MNSVRFELDINYGNYAPKNDSSLEMCILGSFLSNVSCHRSSFKDFALNDWEDSTAGNITSLRKEGGYIYLSDLYSEEKEPTELKMAAQQFVQLLDDWQEKVCKHKPKEVIIKHENDTFTIEIID